MAAEFIGSGLAFPVRIDPTFSDANWVSLNPGIPGTNSAVNAAVVDGSGNLYIGGYFTFAGTGAANYIAKWNGSTWSALGTGMDNTVYALAVSGTDRARCLAQLKAFAEQNRVHPFAADAQRVISQIEKAR